MNWLRTTDSPNDSIMTHTLVAPQSSRTSGLSVKLAACVLLGGVLLGLTGCDSRSSRTPTPKDRPRAISGRPALPSPRPDDFVGSEACAACHAEIYADYQEHPMGRSLASVEDATPIEDYPSGKIEIPGPRRYRVEVSEEGVTHHEYLLGSDGEVLYDQGEPVDFALGSGGRGRAYLIEKEGLLYQSPLGWYSHASRWNLSPGYDPASHPRFQRRIGDGCLYCHAGQVASSGMDHYDSPIFLEASIGCERCHGPAGAHVALHEGGHLDPSARDPIVNPAKLEVERRESVCNQCHLQGDYVIRRFGREFFDFRPGDHYEDIFVCLVTEDRIDSPGRGRAASQVEQMRSSRCYEMSEAALGCISCHDPHRRVSPEQRHEYYRERCLDCHVDQGCSLPEPDRQAPPALGSCVHCHMPALPSTEVPHTAQTDHRILRRPSDASPAEASPRRSGRLQPFGGAAERLPAWEVSRARGIALMTEAWRRQDRALASQAHQHFVPPGTAEAGIDAIIAALGKDVPALSELAASYLLIRATEPAEQCWQRVLELEPENETALGGLALLAQQRGDVQTTENLLGRLLVLDPHNPQWHSQQAQLFWQRGARAEALAASKRVLELDPTRTEVRRWIAEVYRRLDRPEESEHHRELAERIEAALEQGGRAPGR